MATQTTATQQVIGKIEGGDNRVRDRDLAEGSKGGFGAKGGSDNVDFISGAKMQRSGSLAYLPGMAAAAEFLHLLRMGGFTDEIGVSLSLRRGF